MRVGNNARQTLAEFGRKWKQGEHVVITAGTGYGKTEMARQVVDKRIERNGYVIVFVGKLTPDDTLVNSYPKWEWKVWHEFKRNPTITDNKILLMPDTRKAKTLVGKRSIQRLVFEDAFNRLANIGKWTVQIDEGLYTCHPQMLNLGTEVAISHAMGRSSGLSIVTLAQRPANIPLIVYSSAAHSFVGRAREYADIKRLSEVTASSVSSRELRQDIGRLKKFDFLWLSGHGAPHKINLSE